MGKRRHLHDGAQPDAHLSSTAETLHQVKRARTASVDDGLQTAEPLQTTDKATEEDGWQTVVRKGRKHENRLKQQDANERRSPRVYFQHQNDDRPPIRLEDLRNLVLYVLSDGKAPSWIAVDGRRDIEKVVAVMIPGMDQAMLNHLRELDEKDSNAESRSSIASIGRDDPAHASGTEPIERHTSDADSIAPEIFHRKMELDWLLDSLFAVRAPGDTRQSKVHSPLQAMLLKGHDHTPSRNSSSAQEKSYHAVRTSITEFVHTADELQEAEYPVHTALFASRAHADLEAARRKRANQVAENGWVDSDVRSLRPVLPDLHPHSQNDFVSQGLNIYAIDCEMVLTTDEKSSLARVSVVSWPNGKVIMDTYVKPDLPITNYFTQYSGITKQILENVTTSLSEVQNELKQILTPSTIILGHSLESDLNALKMTHPFIVDTSIIYPHPRGLPLRSSLKFLANKYLKREIQKGGANGHDSVEDARAVLDLVKLKCEKGPRWGTNEANGETLFKLLGNKTAHDGSQQTSAIVEYGTPERGFGKEATFAIGCQNDDEILKGISRSVHGDEDENTGRIPKTGVQFVWARLRALEFARGWVTNNRSNVDTTSTDQAATSSPSQNNPNPSLPQYQVETTPETDAALLETAARLNQIRKSLPQRTLLVLCSGISDMRTVMHYQSLQAQYRREFKVKKWNELTVRWTDVEEQELRKAVDKARTGWGWVGVL